MVVERGVLTYWIRPKLTELVLEPLSSLFLLQSKSIMQSVKKLFILLFLLLKIPSLQSESCFEINIPAPTSFYGSKTYGANDLQ